MKRKLLQALCWVIIVLLAIGMATDWLVLLGCVMGWQYIFNFASLMAMPFLLSGALPEKFFEEDDSGNPDSI